MLRNQNISNQAYISQTHKWKFHNPAPLEADNLLLPENQNPQLQSLDAPLPFATYGTSGRIATEATAVNSENLGSVGSSGRMKGDRRSIGVQTDLRESETQTMPYTPKEYVLPGTNPEVLKIKHFRYGKQLPPTLGLYLFFLLYIFRIWRRYKISTPNQTLK